MRKLKNTNIYTPDIGEVVSNYGDRLIVVGTFCPVNSVSKYPSYFGVSENALADYFGTVRKCNVYSALSFSMNLYEPSAEIMRQDKSKVLLFIPLSSREEGKGIGRYAFGIPEAQQAAMEEEYALLASFRGDEGHFIVDGHYLTGTREKPVVMTTFYNTCLGGPIYKNIPLGLLVPVRPNGLGPRKNFAQLTR